jgi:hypothetical protein
MRVSWGNGLGLLNPLAWGFVHHSALLKIDEMYFNAD